PDARGGGDAGRPLAPPETAAAVPRRGASRGRRVRQQCRATRDRPTPPPRWRPAGRAAGDRSRPPAAPAPPVRAPTPGRRSPAAGPPPRAAGRVRASPSRFRATAAGSGPGCPPAPVPPAGAAPPEIGGGG